MQYCPLYFITIIHNQRIGMQSDKENQPRRANSARCHHPSNQSLSRDYRPSIKVGYEVVHVQQQQKNSKKKVSPKHQESSRPNCKKIVQNAKTYQSGKFTNSQYAKENENPNPKMFIKKGVVQSRDKYQSGQAFKQQFETQFVDKDKSSRRSGSISNMGIGSSKVNTLPSYQNKGIKDIMEYQHAKPYRQIKVTEKCTNNSALSRFFKYEQLHEFDFRKKVQNLR